MWGHFGSKTKWLPLNVGGMGENGVTQQFEPYLIFGTLYYAIE